MKDVGVVAAAVVVCVPPTVSLVLGGSPLLLLTSSVATVALLAATALRHRRTDVAGGLAVLGMLVLLAAPNLPDGPSAVLLPVSLTYLLVLHAVASAGTRARAALAVSLVGAALATARVALVPPDGDALPGWPLALLGVTLAVAVVAAWALGTQARTARRLRAAAVAEGVARERREVAAEVHDVLAHSLAVVLTRTEAALVVMDADPERARGLLEGATRAGREASHEIRGLLGQLRDPAPGAAVSSWDDVRSLVERSRSTGLTVDLRLEEVPIGPAALRAAHRIVQESLTNVLKHVGPGARVTVDVAAGEAGTVVVRVGDDGPGRRPGASGGHGLVGMRERARGLGGSLDVDHADGTVVTAVLPGVEP